LFAQIMQDRIVKRTIRIGKAAPHGGGALDLRHRAVAEYVALQQFECAFVDDRPLIRRPHEQAAHELRMQGPHEHHRAPDRKADRGEPLA
jgi:hypothetical protein